jgi:hypothetical protein
MTIINKFKKKFEDFLINNFKIDISVEQCPNRSSFIVKDNRSKQDILYVIFDTNPHHFNLSPTFEFYAAHQSGVYLLKKIYEALAVPIAFRTQIINDFNETITRYPFVIDYNLNLFTESHFIKPFNVCKIPDVKNRQDEVVFGISTITIASIPLMYDSTIEISNTQKFSFVNDSEIVLVDIINFTIMSKRMLNMTAEMNSNYAIYRWINLKHDYTANLLELMSSCIANDVLNAYGEKPLYKLTPDEIKAIIEISEMFNI